jgi:NADH-quinone oxidoreductase subunit L
MRIMGGLRKSMPWTFGAYLLAAASMAGIPLTSGFLSKESILTGLFSNEAQPDAIRILWLVLGLGSIVLTTAYLGRQANLVFGGNTRYFRLSGEGIKPVPIPDPSFVMLGPMALLALGTLFPIFSMSPFQVESAWALHLWPTSPVESAAWLPWFSLLLIVTGGGLTYLLCRQEEQIRFYRSGRVYRLLQQHFYQEKIYQKLFFSPFLTFSGAVKWVDERLVDGFFTMGARLLATSRPGWPQLSLVANWVETQVFDGLVRGIFQGIGLLGLAIRKIQSGRVQWYIGLSLALWVLLLVWIALAIKN